MFIFDSEPEIGSTGISVVSSTYSSLNKRLLWVIKDMSSTLGGPIWKDAKVVMVATICKNFGNNMAYALGFGGFLLFFP